MDQKLLLLINREWTSPAADRFMAVMSSLDFWLPFLALAIVILAIAGKFRERAFLVTVFLALAINDGVLSNTLKHAIHRPRPHQALSGLRIVDLAHAKPRILALAKPLKITFSTEQPDHGQGRSFPSSHVVNTMTAATAAMLFYPRLGWLGFLLPLLVGYSRVYVGSHWPSDVLASLLAGAGFTLLFAWFLAWLWARVGTRILPLVYRRHPALFTAS